MNFATIKGLGCFGNFAVAGWRQVSRAATIAGVMLGVTGCATGPLGGVVSKDSSPEAKVAAVTRKAEARWDALIKGNVEAAYAYLSPASRGVVSLERYKARTNPGSFRAVKLDNASCEAESCRLRFWLTFDHRVMQGVTTPIEETWVIEDGEPWFVYRE